MITAVVLLVLGIALIVAEVFLVSFGILAVGAGLSFLLADWIAFSEGPVYGWSLIAAEIILIPLVLKGAFRVLPHTRFGKRMVLTGPATAPASSVPSYDRLVAARGRAVTDLRPSGLAEFGDERVSVVSLGGLVPHGSEVVVVAVEGSEIRVRPHVAPLSPSEAPRPESRP